MKKQYWLIICLCALLLQGCGNQVNVSGRVTFPDGEPLTRGEVRFQTPTFMATGDIQPDGSYVLSSLGTNDGIPRGTYTVTVSAFADTGSTAGMSPSDVPPAQSLIDLRFNSPATSGLSVDVQGTTVFDFEVEPFTR